MRKRLKNESKWGRQCEGRVNEKIDYYFCCEKGNEKIERRFKQRSVTRQACVLAHIRMNIEHVQVLRTMHIRGCLHMHTPRERFNGTPKFVLMKKSRI